MLEIIKRTQHLKYISVDAPQKRDVHKLLVFTKKKNFLETFKYLFQTDIMIGVLIKHFFERNAIIGIGIIKIIM